MTSLSRRINRPELVLRPGALARRVKLGLTGFEDEAGFSASQLPWDQTIELIPDLMGRNIRSAGVFDVCATEAVYRLLDEDGHVADIGANVGYFTNLIASRLGAKGRVLSVEPQAEVFAFLERNAGRWAGDPALAAIELHRAALSSESGSGYLKIPAARGFHTGLASLRDDGEGPAEGDQLVELKTLDELVGPDLELKLLKVDVEGHELGVLEGAERLLSDGRVRDVVFEEQSDYPTATMTLLEGHGMTVFTLDHTLFGPKVHPVTEGPAPKGWPGPNYLATLDPRRALDRLSPRGWRSLGIGRPLGWLKASTVPA